MTEKTGLILEGGGVRGAYTAGALSWLAEKEIEFEYNVGISSGAAYLALHVSGATEIAHKMSTGFAVDPQNIGVTALLRCGHYVDGERIFGHYLQEIMGFRADRLRSVSTVMETGVYDLEKGETVFFTNRDADDDLDLIRAGCSLPVASPIVEIKGRKVLDGGITKMIPIERAMEQGCTKCLVITTKPAGYVRKPSSRIILFLMRILYPKYPSIRRDYKVRHLNYYKQMELIRSLTEKGQALLIAPSASIQVNRFKGDPEKCRLLYEMGYRDMQVKEREILEFLGR